MKNYYYFKELTKERENKIKTFDRLSAAEFDELTTKARAEFNAQNVKAAHGRKNFDHESAIITGPDTLNGFYFPGAELINPETNYKLLLIAFETVRGYDFEKHEPKPETLRPVAIYEDERETLYTIHTATLDTRPLDDWKKELQKNSDSARARAELWRNVKRLYKKNGEPFALISKNFDGVQVIEDGSAYKLEISGRDPGGAWISDTLYNCDRYPLKNIDDIIPSIIKYSDYLTEYANEQENILKFADSIYGDVFGGLFEKILKYQTPSNADGVQLKYFIHTVREMINKFYVSI